MRQNLKNQGKHFHFLAKKWTQLLPLTPLLRDIITIRHDPHPPPQLLNLANSMQGVVHFVHKLDGELDRYRTLRDSMCAYYSDGLFINRLMS